MKLNSQKEKFHRGKRLIPRSILNGITRDEYCDIWDDNCMLGFLYCLWKADAPLTYKEIGLEIGWGWRTVKSQRETLQKTIIGRTLDIKSMSIKRRGCSKAWYINNKDYLNTSFEELVRIIRKTHYKTCHYKANGCEKALLEICNEIHPKEWEFTGARFGKNRIGRYYPDLTNKKRRFVLEHYGSWCHQPEDEKRKEENYLKQDFRTISIWDYDENDRNKYKKMIKDSCNGNQSL